MTDDNIEIFKNGIVNLKKGISDSFYIFIDAIEKYPNFVSMLLKDKCMENDIEIIKKKMENMKKEIFNSFQISFSKVEKFSCFMTQAIENGDIIDNTEVLKKSDVEFEKKDVNYENGNSDESYFSLYV